MHCTEFPNVKSHIQNTHQLCTCTLNAGIFWSVSIKNRNIGTSRQYSNYCVLNLCYMVNQNNNKSLGHMQ